jgi:hypothetical protein
VEVDWNKGERKALGVFPRSSLWNTPHPTWLSQTTPIRQGVDLAGTTTLAVLGVLLAGAAPRELAAAPASPWSHPRRGIETALAGGDASDGDGDHGSSLGDPSTPVVSAPGYLSGQAAGIRQLVAPIQGRPSRQLRDTILSEER